MLFRVPLFTLRTMIPSTIFKSYDIRGLAPEEIDAATARRIGKSLARIYRPKQVLVGHDMRLTSQELEEALIEGLTVCGVSVTRIGLCSTPMFYAAVGEGQGAFDLGVMVTASHNPGKYNGFKLVAGDLRPIGQGSGMEELRDLAISEEPLVEEGVRGTVVTDEGVLERYVDRVWNLAALPKPFPDWNIAIDAGSGMNGMVLPSLTRKLSPMRIEDLYWDPDGGFPHHEANPLNVETLKKLQEVVRRQGSACGVAFDGDGDRVGFVDEKGEPIPGDILTALFARELLREHGPMKILYDLRSSWTTPEVIRANGGTAEMCRVGHAHIKKQMREEGATFAGELSMHFYFKDFGNCESSDYAMLLMLKMLMREQKPLSQIWKPLQTYVHSGEINFHVKDTKAVLATIEALYKDAATSVSRIDGIRFEFSSADHPENDWWFSLRASNTEPVIRLNLEARQREKMEEERGKLAHLIEQG